jgi:hypothetical protein
MEIIQTAAGILPATPRKPSEDCSCIKTSSCDGREDILFWELGALSVGVLLLM